MKMSIFAPSDEASPSAINLVSTFPTTKTTKEIVDRLLTKKIRVYCEGKLINDHNEFIMFGLNYEKLKTFMEKLKEGQIFQMLKLYFLETCNLKSINLLPPQWNLKNSKSTLKWQFLPWWPKSKSSSLQVTYCRIIESTQLPLIWRLMWPNIGTSKWTTI